MLLCCCAWASTARAAETPTTAPSFATVVQPFLQNNCFVCHGENNPKGDLNLQLLGATGSLTNDRPTWELILRRVQKGEMPPADEPRPDPSQLSAFTTFVKSEFEAADKSARPEPGRVTIRRLNRSEYNNTVRDLLGVDFHPADDFPQDDSGYGFDNIGDVLSVSPMLMEKYLKAAEKIARRAVYGVEKLKPVAITHQPWYIDFDTQRVVTTDYDETGLSMPYSAHAMHRIEAEGEYEITGWVRGFRPIGSDPLRLGFWVDGKMVAEGKVIVPPDGELNGLSDTIKVKLMPGDHWLAVTLLKIYEGLPPAYGGPNPSQSTARITKVPTEFFAQNIRVVGPLTQVMGPSAQSQKKIYAAVGGTGAEKDLETARKILTDLAHRAFRRPVSSSEVDQLVRLVSMVQKEGDSFEEGLVLAIEKILISPNFLFMIEQDPLPGSAEPRQLNPHELATRLSYFLWSSMPDDALLTAADEGKLNSPQAVEAQVRRMLKDPRSHALVENFGGQWLQFRALESHTVERKNYQQYTDYTIMSMQKETELFFGHIIQEDRPITDFIDADYTFLNQRLAEFYGIPGVKGHEFRKVQLPPESHRRGVITQASVLTVSSYSNRTSPVIRGKWILDNIMNAPPPPPPPNVPSLEADANNANLPMREQLQKHRENPTCASCHARMDPLGFGLENFNAIGQWRDQETAGAAIDASGELPGGAKFNGPDELRQVILQSKADFADCLADKMLTYALGRGLTGADQSTVRSIGKQVAENDYRFSSLVLGIVNSPQFQMRSAK
jgi:hypothetical protein